MSKKADEEPLSPSHSQAGTGMTPSNMIAWISSPVPEAYDVWAS